MIGGHLEFCIFRPPCSKGGGAGDPGERGPEVDQALGLSHGLRVAQALRLLEALGMGQRLGGWDTLGGCCSAWGEGRGPGSVRAAGPAGGPEPGPGGGARCGVPQQHRAPLGGLLLVWEQTGSQPAKVLEYAFGCTDNGQQACPSGPERVAVALGRCVQPFTARRTCFRWGTFTLLGKIFIVSGLFATFLNTAHPAGVGRAALIFCVVSPRERWKESREERESVPSQPASLASACSLQAGCMGRQAEPPA